MQQRGMQRPSSVWVFPCGGRWPAPKALWRASGREHRGHEPSSSAGQPPPSVAGRQVLQLLLGFAPIPPGSFPLERLVRGAPGSCPDVWQRSRLCTVLRSGIPDRITALRRFIRGQHARAREQPGLASVRCCGGIHAAAWPDSRAGRPPSVLAPERRNPSPAQELPPSSADTHWTSPKAGAAGARLVR